MKKKTLVQRLHGEYYPKHSKRKVYRMVNFLLEKMKEAILYEKELKVYHFGTFKKKGRRVVFRASKKVLQKLKSDLRQAKMYL